MSRSDSVVRLTYTEYLAREAQGEVRHEFLKGEVFEMTGGTPEHGAIAVAIGAELRAALRGRPCRVFSSDVRVRIRATGLTTYPDISVVCGALETDAEDKDAITNPVLLVEVLSPSTEAYDRGAKAAHYRQLPSLRELMLVSLSEPRIELQRRNEGGIWELHDARPGSRLRLASVDVDLDVSAVFENPLPSAAP